MLLVQKDVVSGFSRTSEVEPDLGSFCPSSEVRLKADTTDAPCHES
jgi:hypothetical protein